MNKTELTNRGCGQKVGLSPEFSLPCGVALQGRFVRRA